MRERTSRQPPAVHAPSHRVLHYCICLFVCVCVCAHREDREHHVVVVDEEEQLLLAERELGRHAQDEVLHLRLQYQQTLIHLEWNTDGWNGIQTV